MWKWVLVQLNDLIDTARIYTQKKKEGKRQKQKKLWNNNNLVNISVERIFSI